MQTGLYVVPNTLIMQNNHYLPALYVATMRFSNMRNEVVSSIALLLKFLDIPTSDKPFIINQQMRKGLHIFRRKKIITHASFGADKKKPTINYAFTFKFAKGYGWARKQHISAGYIKEAEIDKIRKGGKRQSVGMAQSIPTLIHTLLYCRMIMEKPGGVTKFKTAEQKALGIVLERDVLTALDTKSHIFLNTMRALQRLRILDFRRRIVRENKWSPPRRIYVITNYYRGHMKQLQLGLDSLEQTFASCEFIPDTEVIEDRLMLPLKESDPIPEVKDPIDEANEPLDFEDYIDV